MSASAVSASASSSALVYTRLPVSAGAGDGEGGEGEGEDRDAAAPVAALVPLLLVTRPATAATDTSTSQSDPSTAIAGPSSAPASARDASGPVTTPAWSVLQRGGAGTVSAPAPASALAHLPPPAAVPDWQTMSLRLHRQLLTDAAQLLYCQRVMHDLGETAGQAQLAQLAFADATPCAKILLVDAAGSMTPMPET